MRTLTHVALTLSLAVALAVQSPLDTVPASLRARLEGYGHAAVAAPSTPKTSSAPSFGVRISPLDFGGDPTGRNDSSPAFAACVAFCVNYSAQLDYLGHIVGDASFPGGKYIANAGGCTIDLGGGEYKLASPVVIPEFVGNINFGHGALVADPAFPPASFLVVIGIDGSCKIPQGSCNVAINFDELFFDGSRVASALQINNVMGTTVTNSYFLNFSSYGVQINAGHEVMMHHCWLGETPFDYPWSMTDLPKAIAIQINGNDHFISSTIVFSSMIGLEVNGAANYIEGVHVWFPSNQALAFVAQGVMAFHITEGQNRFSGCYIDGSRAVFEGRGLSGNMWANGFECCAGSGLGNVPHGIELHGDHVGPGLEITHSIFRGGSIYSTPATPGAVATVTGTRIEGNSFSGTGAGTRATLSLTQTAATTWAFDACSLLIFPRIERVVVSIITDAGFPVAVARTPVNCSVVVETSEPVTGTVTVTVDSSVLSPEFV